MNKFSVKGVKNIYVGLSIRNMKETGEEAETHRTKELEDDLIKKKATGSNAIERNLESI